MTRLSYRAIVLALCIFIGTTLIQATEFYVAPTGSSFGNGSISSPWDLATALRHPAALRPGDTVWLRGGTYRGTFRSSINGTATAPIVVRRYRDERAIIDGAIGASASRPMYSALTIVGAHTWYWGFEITNSEPNRQFNNSGCWDGQHCRSSGVDVMGAGVKLINLVIHDTGNGFGMWSSAVGAEAYGNLVYNVGWDSEVRGSGHGVYAQNQTGTMRLANNIILNGHHSAIHIYGSSASFLRNFNLEGNILFNNGLLSRWPNGWGIILGGGVVAENITIRDNALYNPSWFTRSNNLDPSYSRGTVGLNMTNNYSVGYKSIDYNVPATGLTATGNSFFGYAGNLARQQISTGSNTFGSAMPAQNRVFVRRNQYEPNLANIAVFNGSRAAIAAVDVSSVLVSGDLYDVFDAQNYFGAPVLSGTYDGTPIRVPMTTTGIAQAVGNVANPAVHSSVEFGAFILRKRASSSSAPNTGSTPDSSGSSSNTVQILLEAESGRITAPMATWSHPSASKGTFVISQMVNTGDVEMTFNAPATGTYAVWAKVYTPTYNSDSYWVSVDGGTEALFDQASGWTTSFRWVRLHRRSGSTRSVWDLALPAGQHRIKFRSGEITTGIDCIMVTNNLSFIPQ